MPDSSSFSAAGLLSPLLSSFITDIQGGGYSCLLYVLHIRDRSERIMRLLHRQLALFSILCDQQNISLNQSKALMQTVSAFISSPSDLSTCARGGSGTVDLLVLAAAPFRLQLPDWTHVPRHPFGRPEPVRSAFSRHSLRIYFRLFTICSSSIQLGVHVDRRP